MIRVMTADELASTTITVDGKLYGDYVDPLETCCKQAISKGKPVWLYLPMSWMRSNPPTRTSHILTRNSAPP